MCRRGRRGKCPVRLRTASAGRSCRRAGFGMGDCFRLCRRGRDSPDQQPRQVHDGGVSVAGIEGSSGRKDLRLVPGRARRGGKSDVQDARPRDSSRTQLRPHAVHRPPRPAGVGGGVRGRRPCEAAGVDMDWLRGGAGSDRLERGRRVARRRFHCHRLPGARYRRRITRQDARRREQRRPLGMAHGHRLEGDSGQRSGGRQWAGDFKGREMDLRSRVGQSVVLPAVARADARQARQRSARLSGRQHPVGA